MTKKGLYIQMFSIHGLLRYENLEMGRDADTGGQIKYVIELANQLSRLENVRRIDLLTRLIDDKTVSTDYSQQVEEVNEKFRIIRINCGGKKYKRKESLWAFLPEYIDKTIKFIKREKLIPDIFHGHYADGGFVARELAEIFGVPFIFTGHSMGREKLQKLLADGMKEDEIIKKYKIHSRIQVEEDIIANADLIITSTNQEIRKQYAKYDNSSMSKYKVIPPGIDIDKFYPYYHDLLADSNRNEEAMHAQASVLQELNRFFMKPDMPIILSLCRPDKKKNITGLIEAYGQDLELQAMANLAIFAGIRKDIHDKEENERSVLTEILLLMDKYDLYGKMAIPKKHDFELEVPELYRIIADKKGVFVNPALTEPFGLTLLEAAASGVPIVATNDGGPTDIIKNCKNGLLVDPTDHKQLSNSIKSILTNNLKWDTFSKNGVVNVKNKYTWKAHANVYLKEIERLVKQKKEVKISEPYIVKPIGKRLAKLNHFIITDIDNTLIGPKQPGLDNIINKLEKNRKKLGFGVATGRSIESAIEYLEKYNVPIPDIIISSVGTEIYYGPQQLYDNGWDTHLSHKWNPDIIRELLLRYKFLKLQEKSAQRKYKLSYYMKPKKDRVQEIHRLLHDNKLRYNLIYSHDKYLDILPYRASKGKAIRYICYKWQIHLENIVVCGDSGNDEEMLRGETLGIVVGNYSHELEKLKGLRRIYFSDNNYAAGIIDGIKHYNFITKIEKRP